MRSENPLEFSDPVPYKEQLLAAHQKTGLYEAVRTVETRLNGIPIHLAVMDFRFIGGSMGSVVGEKIARLADRSLEKGYPLVIVSASGGARMQEGALSLMQMAKTASRLARIHEKGIPYISILTHPTTGGVTASFAMLGDIIFAEPGALIGFAGPRVIRQTIGEELPEGFQTAEFLLKKGFVDAVVDRRHLKKTIDEVLKFYYA
jgi:acetyl-CoA carboxylase carboxyl transferase subunit beta